MAEVEVSEEQLAQLLAHAQDLMAVTLRLERVAERLESKLKKEIK